jgi:hypothetical protein
LLPSIGEDHEGLVSMYFVMFCSFGVSRMTDKFFGTWQENLNKKVDNFPNGTPKPSLRSPWRDHSRWRWGR